jgi:tetratricopeptide (TPR) repeat protein
VTLKPALAGCLCAVVVAMASAAAAKPSRVEKTQAKTWYSQGVAHMKAKRHREAAQSFEQAYQLDPNPNLLWNIARAYEENKDYDLAILRFSTLLELDDTPAKLRKQGSERLVEIQRRVDAEQHAAKVTEQEGQIRTQEAARCQIRVTEVEQQRVAEGREQKTALERRIAELEATLEAKAGAAPAAPPPEPGSNDMARREGWQMVVKDRDRAGQGLVRWGGAALAVGLAAAGTGIGLHSFAVDLRQDVVTAQADQEFGVVNQITRTGALGRERDANQVEAIGIIAMAAGSALAITGTILLIYSAVDPGGAPSTSGVVPNAVTFRLDTKGIGVNAHLGF